MTVPWKKDSVVSSNVSFSLQYGKIRDVFESGRLESDGHSSCVVVPVCTGSAIPEFPRSFAIRFGALFNFHHTVTKPRLHRHTESTQSNSLNLKTPSKSFSFHNPECSLWILKYCILIPFLWKLRNWFPLPISVLQLGWKCNCNESTVWSASYRFLGITLQYITGIIERFNTYLEYLPKRKGSPVT